MSTLELAFAIFFAVNFFFCLYIAANKIKYLLSRSRQRSTPSRVPDAFLSSSPVIHRARVCQTPAACFGSRIMKMMRTLKLFRLARGPCSTRYRSTRCQFRGR